MSENQSRTPALSPADFHIDLAGQRIPVREGQTIAGALIAAGIRAFRRTESGSPRGLFCGMGACFDCLVSVDGVPNRRACMTLARPGSRVELPGVPSQETGVSDATD